MTPLARTVVAGLIAAALLSPAQAQTPAAPSSATARTAPLPGTEAALRKLIDEEIKGGTPTRVAPARSGSFTPISAP